MGVVTIGVVLLTVVLKLTGCGISLSAQPQTSDWKGKEVEGTENFDVAVVVETCRFFFFLKAVSLFVSYYVISKRIHEMSRQK